MRTDKEQGALRVLEALSAVDEELLERSGKTTAERKNKITVYCFVRRYAAACAACLCLLVLGAAYFGMSRIRIGSAGKSEGISMNSGGTGNDSGPMAAGEETAAQEAAEDSFSGGKGSVRTEPEWLDVERLTAWSDTVRDQGIAETVEKNELQQSAGTPADSEGAEAQESLKREVFGAEASVPERYSPVETETGSQESLLYEWSDGEHSLWLRITQTELTVDLRFYTEPPVYTVQEEWRDLFPDAGTDGYVQFALLYENGMLVEYRGVLEREEIIGLLDSLAW